VNTIEVPQLLSKKIYRKLVFKPEGLTIEKPNSFTPAEFVPITNITAQNMMAFRYGITWTRGYKLVFGRQYFVEIRNDEQSVCRIKLGSYYGIRKDLYGQLWNDIIHLLWKNYFVNIYNYYYDLYKIHQTFELCGISFHFDGIGWGTQNTLTWDEIAISNYYHYFMIYNCNNKAQRKSRSFANDWNAVILQVLLKEIVKERNVLQS
jgi:hypothetical protein